MILESKLQSQFIKHAKLLGWIPLKVIRSNINGIADLILFKNNRVIFVEVKTPKGIVSELQNHIKEQFELQNFEYHICNNLKSFKEILTPQK